MLAPFARDDAFGRIGSAGNMMRLASFGRDGVQLPRGHERIIVVCCHGRRHRPSRGSVPATASLRRCQDVPGWPPAAEARLSVVRPRQPRLDRRVVGDRRERECSGRMAGMCRAGGEAKLGTGRRRRRWASGGGGGDDEVRCGEVMWIGRNGSCSCNAAQRNAGEASGWTTVGGRAGSAPKAAWVGRSIWRRPNGGRGRFPGRRAWQRPEPRR